MKTLLVIAGLDPTGGAGFLADARVAADHGVRAVGVITATTVQDTRGVKGVRLVPPDVVEAQLRALLADVAVDAVKIGMLGHERVAAAVGRALADTGAPVVWDPILMPSRGAVPLLAGDRRLVLEYLLPKARVITPNAHEAEALTDSRIDSVDSMRRVAQALQSAGARAVFLKGGHIPGPRSIDLLRDGVHEAVFDGERLDVGAVHGTGCVLSSALACGLAAGLPLEPAAMKARQYLTERLAAPITVGGGARCLV